MQQQRRLSDRSVSGVGEISPSSSLLTAVSTRVYTHLRAMASLRSEMVKLRLRKKEVALWRAAAKRADKTLSEWIREACEVQRRKEPSA
jgi:hypothetical protein